MEIASLSLMLSATLSIFPNRSQFFQYEVIDLTCVAPATNSAGWSVKRNASSRQRDLCRPGWGIPGKSSCRIEDAFPSDTGVYWCESKQGESSNTITITVTAGPVILESPVFPVTKSDKVTLRCLHRKENKHDSKPTLDFNASFYKNDEFIGTEPRGTMVLSPVSEGFYQCGHPTRGKSAKSWLSVRDLISVPPPPPLPPPDVEMPLPKLLCIILLFLLYTGVLCFCAYLYRRWAQDRAAANRVSSHLVLE